MYPSVCSHSINLVDHAVPDYEQGEYLAVQVLVKALKCGQNIKRQVQIAMSLMCYGLPVLSSINNI